MNFSIKNTMLAPMVAAEFSGFATGSRDKVETRCLATTQ